MKVTSPVFLLFLSVIAVANYLLPTRYRWALLLAGSCIFYVGFIPKYIIVLFVLIAIDYVVALRIEQASGKRRTQYLVVGVIATISILVVFKYLGFFNANIAALARLLHWNYSFGLLSLVVPLGLSFHTFQSLSYLIEVYRGAYLAERHLGHYALYVLFFPQLIAGPIERPQHLLPQLKNAAALKAENVWSGLRLILWGYFKKLVIADRIGVSVDYVWAHHTELAGPSILFAIFFFAVQLYADFSGYVDIARGAARILGVDLTLNFERPYFATSIAEFWRRWHISLSSWFRDYVFTPLGLRFGRHGRRGVYAAVLATFTLMGFWHGAGWTYLLMGLLFGTYISIGIATRPLQLRLAKAMGLVRYPRLRKTLQQACTFTLVACTWVFFRAPTVTDALAFMSQIFVGWTLSSGREFFAAAESTLGLFRSDLLIVSGAVLVLFGVEAFQEKRSFGSWYDAQSLFVRSFVVMSAIFAVFVFSSLQSKQFIYFQF